MSPQGTESIAVGNTHGSFGEFAVTLKGSKRVRPFQGRVLYGIEFRGRRENGRPRLLTCTLSACQLNLAAGLV